MRVPATMAKWRGHADELPAQFPTKAAVPCNLAMQVDFGFQWSWVGIQEDASGNPVEIMMPAGNWADIHAARLFGIGYVIGYRDMRQCDFYGNAALSAAWRGSLNDRIHRELKAIPI